MMSIRIATKTDLPRILQIYGPYVENTTYSFEYTVPSLEAFSRRFDEITAQFPWLVWEEDGVVAGYAYGSAPFHRAAYSWCAEVSIYLAPEFQGTGIGRKSFVILTGEVAAVSEAVKAGIHTDAAEGMLISSVVIPSPHPDLLSSLL